MSTSTIERHTTELTTACLRKVRLSKEGKKIGLTESARYRGLLAHEMIGEAFRRNEFHSFAVADIAIRAHRKVVDNANAEHSPLSEATATNAAKTQSECCRLVESLGSRFPQMQPDWKYVGAELPIRWDMTLPGIDEPVAFASHLDLVFRTPGGYAVVDIKSGEDDPAPHYLRRNLQLACYFIAVRYGVVRIDEGMDLWENLGVFPQVFWLHFNALAPYSRATTATDDNGEVVKIAAGEHRPWHRVMRDCGFSSESEGEILEEIAIRERMFRAGLYPANPDPVGCRVCECVAYCPSYGEKQ